MFLERATAMAEAVDSAELSVEHQKERISIITESSAKAAWDAIAYSDPEDNELKLMRLNSIAQFIATGTPDLLQLRFVTLASLQTFRTLWRASLC